MWMFLVRHNLGYMGCRIYILILQSSIANLLSIPESLDFTPKYGSLRSYGYQTQFRN